MKLPAIIMGLGMLALVFGLYLAGAGLFLVALVLLIGDQLGDGCGGPCDQGDKPCTCHLSRRTPP